MSAGSAGRFYGVEKKEKTTERKLLFYDETITNYNYNIIIVASSRDVYSGRHKDDPAANIFFIGPAARLR